MLLAVPKSRRSSINGLFWGGHIPEENIYFQSYILRDFKEQCLQE